jgi:hypothetical protein
MQKSLTHIPQRVVSESLSDDDTAITAFSHLVVDKMMDKRFGKE